MIASNQDMPVTARMWENLHAMERLAQTGAKGTEAAFVATAADQMGAAAGRPAGQMA